MLQRNAPARVTVSLHANRSISGRVAGASNAVVTLAGSGRSVTTDAEGRYVFRGVSAGPATVIATAGATSWTRTLDMPAAPAVMRDVDFGSTAVVASNDGAAGSEVASLNAFIVQLGAYRIPANAEETAARARTAGVDVEIVRSSELLIVRVGPFHSSTAAGAVVGRLQQAGVDAVVLHVR